MRRWFGALLLLFALAPWSVRASKCFVPATLDLELFRVDLPCVILQDLCYSVTLSVERTPGQVFFGLVKVDASDIPLEEIEERDLLPYYDPETETLVIPAVMVEESAFRVELKSVWAGDEFHLSLVGIVPVPVTGLPICYDEDDGDGPSGDEGALSYRVKFSGRLAVCYEFRGPPDFLAVAEQGAVPMPFGGPDDLFGGLLEVVHEPCPDGFTMGCYLIDEDGNWYATYKYPHLMANFLFPSDCPEEDGYHYIFP